MWCTLKKQTTQQQQQTPTKPKLKTPPKQNYTHKKKQNKKITQPTHQQKTRAQIKKNLQTPTIKKPNLLSKTWFGHSAARAAPDLPGWFQISSGLVNCDRLASVLYSYLMKHFQWNILIKISFAHWHWKTHNLPTIKYQLEKTVSSWLQSCCLTSNQDGNLLQLVRQCLAAVLFVKFISGSSVRKQ